MIQTKTNSKILLLDIEVSPLTSYTWSLWETNVIEVKKDWYMLSFAYKWLGESKVIAKALPMYKGYSKDKTNDKELCEDLWKVLDEADVVIGQNVDAYDIKKANSRFIFHGMKPTSPYKTIDTLKVAKKYFKFDSNKLDHLGKYLGLGRKIETGGFSTWLGCMSGDAKSWLKMVRYNKQDVVLLEQIYLRLRDYMTNHPRTSDRPLDEVCPNCGSTHLQRRGIYRNKTTTQQRIFCSDCGSWNLTKLDK